MDSCNQERKKERKGCCGSVMGLKTATGEPQSAVIYLFAYLFIFKEFPPPQKVNFGSK